MNEPENGFRAPLPGELEPLFPSYRISALIAKGGMGAVYHAIQTSLERDVAIKILPVEFGSDPEFCENFEAEAKAMAKLNHPNLIGVYDFGEVNGMLFIVMEYVPGQSLHEASNGSAVDPADAIRLMTEISSGLAHAHEYGILHRDIKPANILLDSHLQPKIGDFGLARPVDSQHQEGAMIFGTPGYTAPEVLDTPHAVDQRADIYSLGVLLHELLTGLLPTSDPRPPSSISNCDPRLDAVAHKATHPNPQQRYQNAEEIANALREIASSPGPRVLRETSPAPANPDAPQRLAEQPSKNGAGGLLVSLLLVAGIMAVFFFRNQIFPNTEPNPEPAPVLIVQELKPTNPGPTAEEPEPVKPESEQMTPIAEPEPGPTVAESELEPEPTGPETIVIELEPETEPLDAEPVTAREPKFDAKAFLAHARAVMAARCRADIIRHDRSLKKNLADFRYDGRRLINENLPEIHQQAGNRELDEFLDKQREDGNRMGEGLKNRLRFKRWLVELHEEYKKRESKIDEEMERTFTKQEKTYVYGLGLKLRALQKADDPVAADLIKAEIDKVADNNDHFSDLMSEANKG